MITTNKVLPKEQDESSKRKVLNTNKLMPKEYDTEKQEATIIRKPMLTTENMEERATRSYQIFENASVAKGTSPEWWGAKSDTDKPKPKRKYKRKKK